MAKRHQKYRNEEATTLTSGNGNNVFEDVKGIGKDKFASVLFFFTEHHAIK
jgi:hypothetical protein